MNLDFTNQELYDNGINLDVVIVKPGYEDIDKVKKLFDVSFEGEERPKITNLLRDDDKLEFYAFYNDGNFIGASVWVNIMKKIMYGLWLAVNPEFRGHGYGTQIVKFAKLLARKRGKVYMGTIQDPNEKSDNQEYRKFRWNFYKKLGFHLTNYGYTDGKENLKMITLNGRVGKNISNKAVEEAFKYYNNTLNETFNNEIQAQNDDINDAINDLSYIQFEDPIVEQICHEKLHVYTYEDAKKITNIKSEIFNKKSSGYGYDDLHIKYFNELKYFTNLKEIETDAFRNCESLQEITLPENTNYIGGYAFKYCEKLSQIDIPSKIKDISDGAFSNCTSLKLVNLSNDTTTIGKYAFYKCYSLEQINLPNTLTKIGMCAFAYCENLQQIIIPNNVTEIKEYAFAQCTRLKTIKLSNNIDIISPNIFYDCFSLAEVTIPENVKIIKKEAFSDCIHLEKVNISNNVEKIEQSAFEHCTSLKTIIIPDSVNTLSDKAFYSCRNLRSIYVSKYLYNVLQSGTFIGKRKLKIKKDKPKKLINETFNNEIQSEKDNTFSEKIINTLNIDNDLNFAIKARVKKWWNEKKNDINFKNKLEEEHREIIKEPYDSFYYECNKKDCPYFDFISLGISEQYQKDINKDYESYADDFNFIIVPLDRNTICISVYSSIYNEISENDSLLNDSESGWTYTLTDVISDSIRNEQYDKELKDIFKTNLIQNTYKQLSYYEYRRNISDIIKILDKAFNTWVKERFA